MLAITAGVFLVALYVFRDFRVVTTLQYNTFTRIIYNRYLSNGFFALRQFDRPDAEFFLRAALTQADNSQSAIIEEVVGLVQKNCLFEAEALITLLPPEEMGQVLYESNCAPCHGSAGEGGLGPALRPSPFIQAKSDEELVAFMLAGRDGTAMDSFEGILTEDELGNVVIILRAWQEAGPFSLRLMVGGKLPRSIFGHSSRLASNLSR